MLQKQTESALGFTHVPRRSLSDHIVEQIADLISRGTLKAGDRIPSEKRLCEQFGVGRTSVREALRSLSVMGVLESHRGDGTFVASNADRFLERSFHWGLLLDPKVVEDLIETRLMLESHTAFLAATKAAQEDLARMAEAVRLMETHMGDPGQYLEHDLEFHLMIAQATQNSILQSLLSTTRGYLQAWIRETLAPPDTAGKRARLSIAEHKHILRALRNKDGDSARQAMAAHILSSSADLKSRQRQRSTKP
jgi:GntR family transcriptional repressor for pyruvate dehydrogenase complex